MLTQARHTFSLLTCVSFQGIIIFVASPRPSGTFSLSRAHGFTLLCLFCPRTRPTLFRAFVQPTQPFRMHLVLPQSTPVAPIIYIFLNIAVGARLTTTQVPGPLPPGSSPFDYPEALSASRRRYWRPFASWTSRQGPFSITVTLSFPVKSVSQPFLPSLDMSANTSHSRPSSTQHQTLRRQQKKH